MGYPEYLFKASVAVLFSWLLYRICFRRFTFYQWNRVYLVASLTVSLLLPLVRLPRVRTPFSVPEFGEFTLDLFALHVADGPVMLSGNPDPGAGIFPVILYLLGCGGTLLLFAIRYLKMRSVTRSAVLMRPGRLKIYVHKGPSGSFSLFRRIYLDRHTWEKRTGPVIRHEAAHASLHHTLDILFFSLACGILWFNPFIYLMMRYARQNHEYQADRRAIGHRKRVADYLRCLGEETFRVAGPWPASQFKSSTIIKRITMISSEPTPKKHLRTYVLVLPVAGFLLMAFMPPADRSILIPATPLVNGSISLEDLGVPSRFPLPDRYKDHVSWGFNETRTHPFTGDEKVHQGIDLPAPTGTPVFAAGNGKVLKAESVKGWGNLVVITHEKGFVTYYAHLDTILVRAEDAVTEGQEIARVGSSGQSTGPHLHFEVRKDGVPVDPAKYY